MRKMMILVGLLAVSLIGANTMISDRAEAKTGPQNRCYGEIISGIASTWPYAADHESFPPPPGALALWIEVFMPGITVRELQLAFCTEPE